MPEAQAKQAELMQQLEEAHHQLLQSEKMASIGSLAAGVAHEINNPIGFVGSNLYTLKGYVHDLLALINRFKSAGCDLEQLQLAHQYCKEVDLDYLQADVLQLLDESQDGIARVRRIVQDLKDFSHVDHGDWVVCDLHKGLESTLNMVNNELKYKAVVQRAYGQLPEITCLASQINQIFMNLLINAAHAIDRDGLIRIRTWADDEYVYVSISDNGCGIAPENLSRIFDPFYTTKPVGKGTGLGLSLSYGIVKKHGGRIDVQSELGVGTTFTLVLPIEQKNAGVAHEHSC
ncbi:MAG TPA: ATP-binding protein [Limnobacter sp.]|nr:ATP-binding protein [Limnobacter sp.]